MQNRPLEVKIYYLNFLWITKKLYEGFIMNLYLIKRITNQNHVFDYQYLLSSLSNYKNLGFWIRNYVNTHGILILEGIECDSTDVETSALFLTKLCSYVGDLTPHNYGKKDFVWEIKVKTSMSQLKTFSEHNQCAPLHTDSQYRNQPERFIALMSIHQASCGGGHTIILDFREFLLNLTKTKFGSRLIKFMIDNTFPIAVPSIFQENANQKYITQKIISESPLIRYRYDTLKAGLLLLKNNKLEEFHENLDCLDDFIQSSPYQIRFMLAQNNIIFIDNHRFLHGRSSFTDPNRLLLRTRMN
jgi:alpha-ketoglutarate-dependent taurine dioxygenase